MSERPRLISSLLHLKNGISRKREEGRRALVMINGLPIDYCRLPTTLYVLYYTSTKTYTLHYTTVAWSKRSYGAESPDGWDTVTTHYGLDHVKACTVLRVYIYSSAVQYVNMYYATC